MDFSAFSNVFTQSPTDWIILGAFVVLVTLDALRSGTGRAAALCLSLPAALLLSQELPKAFLLGSFATPQMQLGIFIVLVLVLFFVTQKIISDFSGGEGPVQAIVASLAAAVVLIVVWLNVPALQSVWHFGAQVQDIFSEVYRFWWLIGAYTGLAFIRNGA